MLISGSDKGVTIIYARGWVTDTMVSHINTPLKWVFV